MAFELVLFLGTFELDLRYHNSIYVMLPKIRIVISNISLAVFKHFYVRLKGVSCYKYMYNLKALLRPIIAGHKILILLKGHFAIYNK